MLTTATNMPKPARSPLPADMREEIIRRARDDNWSYSALARWANAELRRRLIKTAEGEIFQILPATISYICRKAGLPLRESVISFRVVGEDDDSVKHGKQPPTDPNDTGEYGA